MTVARITEIGSQSPKGFEDAVQQGLARAAKTIRNIQSAWIKERSDDVDQRQDTVGTYAWADDDGGHGHQRRRARTGAFDRR